MHVIVAIVGRKPPVEAVQHLAGELSNLVAGILDDFEALTLVLIGIPEVGGGRIEYLAEVQDPAVALPPMQLEDVEIRWKHS